MFYGRHVGLKKLLLNQLLFEKEGKRLNLKIPSSCLHCKYKKFGNEDVIPILKADIQKNRTQNRI